MNSLCTSFSKQAPFRTHGIQPPPSFPSVLPATRSTQSSPHRHPSPVQHTHIPAHTNPFSIPHPLPSLSPIKPPFPPASIRNRSPFFPFFPFPFTISPKPSLNYSSIHTSLPITNHHSHHTSLSLSHRPDPSNPKKSESRIPRTSPSKKDLSLSSTPFPASPRPTPCPV